MSLQNWSDNTILIELPPEPHTGEALQEAIRSVRANDGCDVVVDFANVDILISKTLSKLVRLHKVLVNCGHRLILCHVGAATKGILSVTGLEDIFAIVEDKFDALATVQTND